MSRISEIAILRDDYEAAKKPGGAESVALKEARRKLRAALWQHRDAISEMVKQ